MADDASPLEVYQLHVWLQAISPAIWRRLLVHSHTTIADLHHTETITNRGLSALLTTSAPPV